jgi:outer membrane protein
VNVVRFRSSAGAAATGRQHLLRTPFRLGAVLIAALAVTGAPAAAQDNAAPDKEPWRYRVTLGAQAYPQYPGADHLRISPLVNVDRERGSTPFAFEAPDDSFDLALVDRGGFSIGPVLNWERSRRAKDVGAPLPKVSFSLEPGTFVSYQAGEHFRLRGEVRKGVTGHKGWIATAGADFIARDGDKWLASLGPRVTWADNRYHDAYFSVTPGDSAATGLAVFDAGSGIESVGGAASLLFQLTPHWGLAGFVKYDRLVGDAARSPIVRQLGSRDQFSGGVGLSYTFGRNVH